MLGGQGCPFPLLPCLLLAGLALTRRTAASPLVAFVESIGYPPGPWNGGALQGVKRRATFWWPFSPRNLVALAFARRVLAS
jgi:hypothetical protein